MIDTKDFKGIHRASYAIAHCQVNVDPLAFFVLDKQLVKGMGEDEKRAVFEDRVIINPEVLNAPIYLKSSIKRPNYAEYMEGCMSFPHRKGKRINRFNKIKVTYQVKGRLFGLKRVTRWLEGLPSQVFQHEFDHCMGANIFFKGLKARVQVENVEDEVENISVGNALKRELKD